LGGLCSGVDSIGAGDLALARVGLEMKEELVRFGAWRSCPRLWPTARARGDRVVAWPGAVRFLRPASDLRASPPMGPTVQPNGYVCATCIAGIGSANGKPRLRRSRLNVWLAWALSVGGPLSWWANYPKVPDKESPWMADRHPTL